MPDDRRHSTSQRLLARSGRGTTLESLSTAILPERHHARYRDTLASQLGELQLLGRSRPLDLAQSFILPYLADLEEDAHPDTGVKLIQAWDGLFRSPRLILTGRAGSGKTTLLRYLAVLFARKEVPTGYVRRLTFAHHAAPVDDLLPIYVPLQHYASGDGDLLAYALGSLAHYGFRGAKGFLTKKLEQGHCLILVDGLDQIECGQLPEGIVGFAHQFPRNQIILATRHVPANCELPGFTLLEVLGFREKEKEAFAQQVIGARSATFVSVIEALERNQGLGQLATTPLLLSALVSRGMKGPFPLRLAPLYEACMEVLLGPWGQDRHTPTAALPDPTVERTVLEELASLLHHRRQHRLSRADMVSSIGEAIQAAGGLHIGPEDLLTASADRSGLLRRDHDGSYAFMDLALQEYLTAHKAAQQDTLEHLAAGADDPWWQRTIALASGLSEDATDMIELIQRNSTDAQAALFLSARCLPDTPKTDPALRSDIVGSLYQVFERDEPVLWPQAANILAGIHGQRIRDYLTGALQAEKASLRTRASLALGRLGESWVTAPLIAALADEEPRVRKQVAWALGHTGDKRAVTPLIFALHDSERQVAEEAARSLTRLAEHSMHALLVALEDERTQVHELSASALAAIGAEATAPLLKTLVDESGSLRLRIGVTEALSQLRDPETIAPLIEVVAGSSGDLREAAAKALGSIGPPATEPLIAALPQYDAGTGMALADALSRIGPAAIGPLIDALDGESPAGRSSAMAALQRIGTPAVPALTEALSDRRWHVRRRAAQILPNIGDDLIVGPLVSALEDEDTNVRAKAARSLAETGDARAVEPLATALRSDPDVSVRRESAKGLGTLRDARSVPPLIEALQRPGLRRAAEDALQNLGEVAVVPLITFLHTTGPGDARAATVRVISDLGMRARLEDPTPLGLAKCYQLLLSQDLAVRGVSELTSHIRWWERGEEIHRSFQTAEALLACDSLEAAAESGEHLEWIRHSEDWLRPTVRTILHTFGDIIESIRVYQRNTSREGQRNALLSALDRLNDIQTVCQQGLLHFESRAFEAVADLWRSLVEDAIKQMRGRAELEMQHLTDRLALRDNHQTVMLVFRLTNVGDSSARNLRVTLKPAVGAEFEVVGTETRTLDPLGSGMQREVEFPIRPHGARAIDLAFEAQWDDDERQNYSRPFSGRVAFYEIAAAYTPIITSPYIAGKPVKTKDLFYGRDEIFEWVRNNISGQHGENVLVLYGERRMGKTSVLYQLLNSPPTPEHVCVLYNIELVAYVQSVAEFLYTMAFEIWDVMDRQGLDLAEPQHSDYQSLPQQQFRDFVKELERTLGDRSLILLVDEFGKLMEMVQRGTLGDDVFDFLRGIIQETNKLAFLFTGTYELRRMQKDYGSILFNLAKVRRIGYLHPPEARRLITEPAAGLLFYHPLVVDKILRVTACHPYFIQYICDSLVRLAQREEKNHVDLVDVNLVLQETIRDTTGHIEGSIFANLPEPEKVALAGLANVTDDIRFSVPPDIVHDTLESRHLHMSRRELMQALGHLTERDLIEEHRLGQQLQYSFKMGVVRMWLKQSEMLLRLSEELKR